MLKLVSSNEQKLKEFARFGLTDIAIGKGRDLKEVDADELTVILYKALDAGKNRIVEDTSLTVEGVEVGVNVRWMESNLHTLAGRKAVWKVYLGLNDGTYIHIYGDEVNGTLVDSQSKTGFGFDSHFQPDGSAYTLEQLSNMKQKDTFSARKKAVDNIQKGRVLHSYKIEDIPNWTGKYQQEA